MASESLVVRVQEHPKLVKEQLPRPTPNAGQVQVKVSHVAQNPTDGMLNTSVCTDKAHAPQSNALTVMPLGMVLCWGATLLDKSPN